MAFAVRIRGHIKAQRLQRGSSAEPQIHDHIHIIGSRMQTGRLVKICKIALPSGIPIEHVVDHQLVKRIHLGLFVRTNAQFDKLVFPGTHRHRHVFAGEAGRTVARHFRVGS